MDVKIGLSPFWLQDRLHAVGVRAINNVVDVTNYVLMEMGQPLHAFDFDRLAEERIVVRTAREGQPFTTLDGTKCTLGADMLMICDGKGPVALAGIMGGLESEIQGDTKRVLIESAYFDPISIRRSAKHFGFSTESSFRFERGVDPEGIRKALDRAAQLMCQVSGGMLADGVIDVYPKPYRKRVIQLSVKRTNRLLGTHLTRDEMGSHLKSLQLDVDALDADRLTVVPPTFRVDLKRPEDLMEEVARLSGYDQVPTTHFVSPVVAAKQDKRCQVRNWLREVLIGFGLSEIVTYSFVSRDACDRLLLSDTDQRQKMVSILNPLSEEQRVLRTSLLPGLLQTMHRNSTQRNENVKVFEIGKIFLNTAQDKLPEEIEMVSGLWAGIRHDRTWHAKETEKVDFYDIKGIVEALCAALNVQDVQFVPCSATDVPYFKMGHAAEVYAADECLGAIGEVAPAVLSRFELKQTALCFDLHFDRLIRHAVKERQVKPISRFPATTRDMALILDDAIAAQRVLEFIASQQEALIEHVEILDMYRGSPIPAGKKSMALRLTYRAFERNLTDSEVNTIHETIAQRILKAFQAQLPPE